MQQLKLTATTLKSYAYDNIWGDSIEEFINKYYAKDDLIKDEDGVPYSEEVQKQLFLDRIAEAVINVLGELEYTVIPAMEKLSGLYNLTKVQIWILCLTCERAIDDDDSGSIRDFAEILNISAMISSLIYLSVLLSTDILCSSNSFIYT